MSPNDGSMTETRTAEAAFEALADETRLAILRTLVEAEEDLSFSELRDRTGVEDSGRFNYHLNALQDGFVRQTEAGDYEVTRAGHTVVGAVLAGTLTATGTVEPRPVEGVCLSCEGPLEARYEDALFEVACRDCDLQLTRYYVPPSVLAHEDEDYPMAAWRYVFTRASVFRAGFCHVCEGPVTESFATPGESFPEGENVAVSWNCERCGEGMRSSLIAALTDEPAVRSFLADHDIDPARDPPWTETWFYADSETRVVSEEPTRVELAITLDDERLSLTIDEDVDIVDAKREFVD